MKISTIKHWLKVTKKLSIDPLFISGGMPRSGSTLLYNILREILLVKWGTQLSSGWCGDIFQLPKGKAYLIKTHDLHAYYRLRAKYRFYTYRDIRVATVSSIRKFGDSPNMDSIRWAINQYLIAKKNCNLLIKYEELISKPDYYINQLAKILQIKTDLKTIVENALNISAPQGIDGPYSKETLLHKDHFTNTRDDEWREIIPQDLQNKIHSEFNWWFKECNYPLE